MTVELDQVVKNLKGLPITLSLDFDGDNVNMFIYTDRAGDEEYTVQSIQEVGEKLTQYLNRYYLD